MSDLFKLINDPASNGMHIYGRPSTGKTILELYRAGELIRSGRRVLYIDSTGTLDKKQVEMVCPELTKFVQTWYSFDNILEAIGTYGADHLIIDDLTPFRMFLSDDGFKSNLSTFMKRLADMGITLDLVNQIREKIGVEHPVPYKEDYVTTHFRNNVSMKRVAQHDNGMVYQALNEHTRLYIEFFIDNTGIIDEAYTIAALLKEPLTDYLRELIKENREEIFKELINKYGYKSSTWI